MRLIDADALLEAICKKYFVGDSTAAKLIKDAQTIKHEPIDINEMVNRFLSWKLPENFSPDAGISFTPEFNKEYMASLGKPPMRHEPIGTNLFDAVQAKAMIEYLLSNAPTIQREGCERLYGQLAKQAYKLALLDTYLNENNIQPPTDNIFVKQGCEQFHD